MNSEEEVKRQRLAYGGDQIYTNIWSGKWCIKDEHKLLSELGNFTGPATATTTATSSGPAYYEAPNGYPTSTIPCAGVGNDSAMMYDSIASISQSQSSLYTPPIGPSIGSSSLTPLVPLSLQDMKFNANNQDQNISPFYTACGSVLPSTDYAYSPAYTQYGGTYGSYSYGTSSGLINSSYYYEGGQNQASLNQDLRSPLAATRANSLVSAASPTGSACTKSETSDIFLV